MIFEDRFFDILTKCRDRQKMSRIFLNNMDNEKLDYLAKILSKQIDKEIFEKKYTPAREVLKLVGAGTFLAASLVMPNLPLALKPFLNHRMKSEREVWKRFNIPYLKRTIQRLEKQKLVEVSTENGVQIVRITRSGRVKILRFALDELEIKKPKIWDGRWMLLSFDLPEKLKTQRKILVEYLKAWGFYPLHKSVYLHGYPCLKEVDFLRAYLGISEYVRVFIVKEIENDREFRTFFGV